ncbi:MAG: 50S ribosomal protein L17, partial [Thermoleophilia bacterium]|nr:50S ribosomal protein L17 [Thermoleophilia bacterium]
DSIETTESRAESLKRLADKYISLAKKGDLASRRRALAFFLDEDAVKKLFDVLAPRYKDRQGGYVRVIKAGNRRGDGAPTAIVRLV